MIKHAAKRIARLALVAGGLAIASGDLRAADGFPAGETYLIQLTRGHTDHVALALVQPLRAGLDRQGLVFQPNDAARLIASIGTNYDGGRWRGSGAARAFLHTRTITIGLSPASHDVEPGGHHKPAFAVIATLATNDTDRTDQFACAVGLAVTALRQNYRPRGLMKVDASRCCS